MFGPVISTAAVERILQAIDNAVSAPAGELLVGGHRIGGELAGGYYIEPTVFGDVDNASELGANGDIRTSGVTDQVQR